MLDLAGPGSRVHAAAEHVGLRATALHDAVEQRAGRDGDDVRAGAAERAVGRDVRRLHGVRSDPGDHGGAEVPQGRARCGVAEGGQGCVLYLMNPQRQELNARDFYDLAAQLTGRQRFVIETGNISHFAAFAITANPLLIFSIVLFFLIPP